MPKSRYYEVRDRLAQMDREITDMNSKYEGKPFPAAVRERWNKLNAERDELAELETRERRALMLESAGNPHATERAGQFTPTVPGVPSPSPSVPREGERAELALPDRLPEAEVRRLHEAVRSGGSARAELRDITGVTATPMAAPFLAGGDYTDMPRVASLFSAQTTMSPVVRVYRTSAAATAAVTAEGAMKPDAGLAIVPVDLPMKKIATRTRVSRELITDFAAFQRVIGQELTRAVVAAENAELTADLLAAPLTAQPSAGGDGIDATADAIAGLQAAGIAPTGIIMSPGRLADIRAVKASTAGTYVVDPTAPGPAGLHGLPVTVTPELSDDVVLVGAFAAAGIVYQRESVSLMTGFTGDDFASNMVTMIAEERLALAVTQPGRIISVDLSTV